MKYKLYRKLKKTDNLLGKLLLSSLRNQTNAREERKLDKLTEYLDDHRRYREYYLKDHYHNGGYTHRLL